MRAVVCEAFGPPENLSVIEVETPEPGPDEILVRVHASGVGFVDGLMIQGLYQIKPRLPYRPGGEFSGTVAALGAHVENFEIGQPVFGMSNSGTFSDYTVANAGAVFSLPNHPNLDHATAAGLPINYATALYGLRDCGNLQPNETVLILGAAGGVGSAAISMAKAMGARVIAGASSLAKREATLGFGADEVVDYSTPDWRDQLKALTPQGLNVVYDPVGGDLADPAFRCLSPGGRFLVVGFASGTIPKIALNLALLKRSAIVGVDWGGAYRAEPSINQELLSTTIEWAKANKLKPAAVDARPLSDVVSALQDQLAGRVVGKLVLENSTD